MDQKPKRKYNKKNKIVIPKAVDNEGNPLQNVFVSPYFVYPAVRRINKDAFIYKEVKEEGKTKRLNQAYNQEYGKMTRLFITNQTVQTIFNLSSKAKDLYLYILYTIDNNAEEIYINREEYMKISNIKSTTTYLEAVADLDNANIIKTIRKKKDLFHINPYFFFNGNRLEKYELHMRIDHDYANDGYVEDLERRKREYWKGSYIKHETYIKDNEKET